MKWFRFLQTISYDNAKGERVTAKAGDEIGEFGILPGCLISCLATSAIARFDRAAELREKSRIVDERQAVRVAAAEREQQAEREAAEHAEREHQLKATTEKAQADKVQADKIAAEKAEADRLAIEQTERERAAQALAEKAEADAEPPQQTKKTHKK